MSVFFRTFARSNKRLRLPNAMFCSPIVSKMETVGNKKTK